MSAPPTLRAYSRTTLPPAATRPSDDVIAARADGGESRP